MSHWYKIVFQHDLHTGKPKQIVAFKAGMGTYEQVMSWPWDKRGCAEAGAWGYKNKAVVGDLLSPIHSPDELMVHVPGTPTGPKP